MNAAFVEKMKARLGEGRVFYLENTGEARPTLKTVEGVPQFFGPLKSLGKGRYSEDRTRLYVRACRMDGTSVWISKRMSDGVWFLEGLFA